MLPPLALLTTLGIGRSRQSQDSRPDGFSRLPIQLNTSINRGKPMSRERRITFRLSKNEHQMLSNYAIAEKITISKSLRRILADALDIETKERGWNPGR